MSDWGAIHQLPQGTDALRLYESINAGVDMVMMGDRERLQDVIRDLIAGVKAGHVSDARINDAVKRILRAKVRSLCSAFSLTSSRNYIKSKLTGRWLPSISNRPDCSFFVETRTERMCQGGFGLRFLCGILKGATAGDDQRSYELDRIAIYTLCLTAGLSPSDFSRLTGLLER